VRSVLTPSQFLAPVRAAAQVVARHTPSQPAAQARHCLPWYHPWPRCSSSSSTSSRRTAILSNQCIVEHLSAASQVELTQATLTPHVCAPACPPQGYAERKVLLLCDVIAAARALHASAAKAERVAAAQAAAMQVRRPPVQALDPPFLVPWPPAVPALPPARLPQRHGCCSCCLVCLTMVASNVSLSSPLVSLPPHVLPPSPPVMSAAVACEDATQGLPATCRGEGHGWPPAYPPPPEDMRPCCAPQAGPPLRCDTNTHPAACWVWLPP
jgi:hypothetical protein